MTADLVAFLRAGLDDDDERAAQAANVDHPSPFRGFERAAVR